MLATSEGLPVLDTQGNPIILDDNYVVSQITVSSDGSLCYPDEQNNAQPIGIQIGVFQFNNPNGLEKLSDSRYKQTAASGEPINEATNDKVEKTKVIQGYLEGSNVQIVDEMVNMIVAQRAYELNSKAITASDEMLQQANNLRR
jgi:flagellar basal-body rod protein FlgG